MPAPTKQSRSVASPRWNAGSSASMRSAMPAAARARDEFIVRAEHAGGARHGDLVLAEVRPSPPRVGLREVRVVERLGAVGDARSLSLIAIHEHELPIDFAPEAIAE